MDELIQNQKSDQGQIESEWLKRLQEAEDHIRVLEDEASRRGKGEKVFSARPSTSVRKVSVTDTHGSRLRDVGSIFGSSGTKSIHTESKTEKEMLQQVPNKPTSRSLKKEKKIRLRKERVRFDFAAIMFICICIGEIPNP